MRLLCLLGTSCEVSPSAATGGDLRLRGRILGQEKLVVKYLLCLQTSNYHRTGAGHYGTRCCIESAFLSYVEGCLFTDVKKDISISVTTTSHCTFITSQLKYG